MPELPEVETTRTGIAPWLEGRRIQSVIVRQSALRWPVPATLNESLQRKTCRSVERRAKYLLLRFNHGTLIIHLGMSGSLRISPAGKAWRKHDHVALQLASDQQLRFHDPRRFGSILWTSQPDDTHPLLQHLGPEPLGQGFDTDHLYSLSRNRKAAVKNFIMDQKIVVGVGNIYASEALFYAGIHPLRQAGRVSRKRYARLVASIRDVLQRAVDDGGTTLRDFVNESGAPGYFAQQLAVYGRDGSPCRDCGSTIRSRVIGQRNSFYCSRCQR